MIPVLFAINEAYLNPLRVTLRSLWAHAQDSCYAVYVMAYQLSDKAVTLLQSDRVALHPQGDLSVIFIDEALYAQIPRLGRWAKEVNFRLFSGELFPALEKMLYLDTDILVQADLGSLYQTELDSYAFAATMEERAPYRSYTIATFMAEVEERTLKFAPHRTPYMNSGVLLLNLEWLRKEAIVTRALHLLRELPQHWFENSRYDFFLMPDQDILYYLAYQSSSGVRYLPDRYNHIVGYYYYKDMVKFASQEVYTHWLGYIDSLAGEHASQTWEDYQPAIIHYADSAPWNKRRGLVPYEELYRAYAKEIGWKLPNKWLINLITWAKRRFFYRKTTRDAWGRKGMALLALNMLMVGLVLMIMTIWLVF